MGQRLAVVVVGLALVLGAVVAVAAAQTFEEALQDPAELCPPAEDELCDEEWDDPWDDLCDELVLLGRGVVVNVLRPAPDVPLYVPKRKDDNGAGALLTARGWPEDPDATYSWTCNTGWTGTGEAATPDYFCTTAPESDVAKVTYTHPEKGSATNDSGPIHVIDAELTLAGVPDAEEESPGGMLIVDGPRRHLAIALSPEDPNTILPFGDPSEPSEHDWWTAKLQGGDEVAFYDAETEGNQLTQDDLTWGWEDEGGEQYYEHDGPSEVWVEALQSGECSIRLTFSFEMFWFYPNPGSATAEDTVKVACVAEPPYTFLLLESVSFSGERYRAVEKDDGTLTYTAPHWLDEDEDGVPDRVYPAAYAAVPVQGGEPARMSAAATVTARPPEAFTPCRIAGVGGGFEFVGSASAQGDVLSLAPTAASKGLDEYKVDLLDKLVIDWSVSVDGGAWMQAGTSANRVYVTWQLPTASPLFETLLWISCNGADGLGGADAAAHAPGIVTAIWGEFTDRHVERVDGMQMKYWINFPPTEPPGNLPDMLRDDDGDGSCYAWSELLHGCLEAQGFMSRPAEGAPTGALDVLEVCVIYVDTVKHPGALGFLVKDWSFSDTPSYPGDPWPYVLGVTAQDQFGVPGQGNANPKSHHADHCVCRIASQIHDPSYGRGAFGTESQHENDAIDGIATVIGLEGRGKVQNAEEQDLTYTRSPGHE